MPKAASLPAFRRQRERMGFPAIANAPIDDEPESEEERQAVAESKAWFKQRGGQGIPHEEVLADFGLTPDDLKNK